MLAREAQPKQKSDKKEKQLEIKKKQNCNDQDVARKLLDEASKSLNKAIEENNVIGFQVARDMVQMAKNNMEKKLCNRKKTI